MTPDQVLLVKDSFRKVVPIAGVAADLFYDRLFSIAPELRSLFPEDMTEQKKKLIAMLATAVGNLHQFDRIASAVQDLGKRHATYGVTAVDYQPVGAALLWTLEQGLGTDFTPPVKTTWTEAYMTLASVVTDSRRPAVQSCENGLIGRMVPGQCPELTRIFEASRAPWRGTGLA